MTLIMPKGTDWEKVMERFSQLDQLFQRAYGLADMMNA